MEDLFEKQKRAVRVVKTALDNAGVHDRDVCAGSRSETLEGCDENFAIFISAPLGVDVEPYYETGKTLTEAVRKILATIKGHEKSNGVKTENQSEEVPF